MDLGLDGKVALVTGASRGIGKAIARRLVEEGCRVVLCARGAEALEAAARELAEVGEVTAVPIDITEPRAAETLARTARETFGRLDILVGSAGGNKRMAFERTRDEDWDELLDLNLKAHLRCSQAALPYFREAGGGAIVFISSIFGREAGGAGLSLYNATKSALISAAKIMAIELAPERIRVNTVAPGSIRFPGGSWDRRVHADPDGMARFVEQNLPIGRFGTADEVADLVAFLASERASLVTGACINIDGGQSRSLI